MSHIRARSTAAVADGPARAKLYRSGRHAHQWIAFLPGGGWWIFPNEINGWSDRRVAIFLDRGLLRPVAAQRAAHTGFREAIAWPRVPLGASA